MNTAGIPTTYEQWRHCITVECGIPLTPEFVRQRLAVWNSESHEDMRRFEQLYGAAHRERVRQRFEQALKQMEFASR